MPKALPTPPPIPHPKTTAGTLQHAQNLRQKTSPSFREAGTGIRMSPQSIFPTAGSAMPEPQTKPEQESPLPPPRLGMRSAPVTDAGRPISGTEDTPHDIMGGQTEGSIQGQTQIMPSFGKYASFAWWQKFLASFLTIEGWLDFFNPLKIKSPDDVIFKGMVIGAITFILKILLIVLAGGIILGSLGYLGDLMESLF